MAYTRNSRRRNKQRPALGMGTGGRSFLSRFFFPDGMVDPDSTNDKYATRQSAYRINLVSSIFARIYWLVQIIRNSLP